MIIAKCQEQSIECSVIATTPGGSWAISAESEESRCAALGRSLGAIAANKFQQYQSINKALSRQVRSQLGNLCDSDEWLSVGVQLFSKRFMSLQIPLGQLMITKPLTHNWIEFVYFLSQAQIRREIIRNQSMYFFGGIAERIAQREWMRVCAKMLICV